MEGRDILEMITIIVLVVGCAIATAVITLTFFVCRRLHELHTQHNKVDGDIFVESDGGVHASFNIPPEEMGEFILLKVHNVAVKGD